MPTFDDIFHLATHYDETDLFHFYGNKNFPHSYSLNSMNLDFTPDSEAMAILEDYFLDYAYQLNLHYYSFQLPMNQPLTPDLLAFAEEKGYGLEINRLLQIEPAFFKGSIKRIPDLSMEFIGSKTLADYKKFTYQEDLQFGTDFAQERQFYYDFCFDEPEVYQIGAFRAGELIGGLDAIEKKQHIEIDNFSVKSHLQRQGIGSAMQQFIMNFAEQKHKSVILVADADDTPLEMYLKQGYHDCGFRIGLNRKIEDDIRAEIMADMMTPLLSE